WYRRAQTDGRRAEGVGGCVTNGDRSAYTCEESVRHSFCFFFFYCYGDHRDLHSFPTRRSSDLCSMSLICCWTSAKARALAARSRSEEHTSELQSRENLVCRLLLEKKKKKNTPNMFLHTLIHYSQFFYQHSSSHSDLTSLFLLLP